MSIDRLKIANYRCLGGDVDISMAPLTVFVGPNGSGKSSILDAIRFVADIARTGLPAAIAARDGVTAIRRWSGSRPHDLRIELELHTSAGPASYGFELRGSNRAEYHVHWERARIGSGDQTHEFELSNGQWTNAPEGLRPHVDPLSLALTLVGGDARFSPIYDSLLRTEIYSIFPDALASAQKYDPRKPMAPDGRNWVSILKDQKEKTWKPELVAALHRLTGDIKDIRVTRAADYLAAQFGHEEDGKIKWFDASQESDGTLRVAGIISALLQQPPLFVVGIEEPELTIHPGALPLLHDFLSAATTNSQVLVTTHSPELLDKLDVDSVRVVQRHAGVASVSPLSNGQKTGVRKGLLTLGEVMLTEGLQQELPIQSA